MPHVVPHPNSCDIGFLGVGNFTLMDMRDLHMRCKDKGLTGSKFIHMDISPNGAYVGIICRPGKSFEILLLRHDLQFLPIVVKEDCHKICKGFYGNRRYTDHVEGKFSPDSRFFAVGASFGKLFVVKNTNGNLIEQCLIIPGMFAENDVMLANARTFDFDPRLKHKILTFASSVNEVYFCDVDNSTVLQQFTVEVDGSVQILKYGVRAEVLAVATSEAVINMYCPDSMNRLYTLDAKSSAPESCMKEKDGNYPLFLRMSFSRSGDIMSVTSTDGIVRLWQLCPDLSLRHLSKLAVLQSVKVCDLHKLPLPPPIILDLLEWPTD